MPSKKLRSLAGAFLCVLNLETDREDQTSAIGWPYSRSWIHLWSLGEIGFVQQVEQAGSERQISIVIDSLQVKNMIARDHAYCS